MPLETLDQTVRKGKCHRKIRQIRQNADLTSNFAGLPTSRQEGPCSDAIMQSRGLGCLH